MLAFKTLLCITLAIVAVVQAAVTSPSSSSVWTEGSQIQIVWQNISPGTPLTLVLHRVNSVYHHTIISYTPNTGIYTWQVATPTTDGWPSSSASDRVYQIDFYANGGWNNGGQLVAQSDQFAIVWGTGGGGGTTMIVVPAVTVLAQSTVVFQQTQPLVTATVITSSSDPTTPVIIIGSPMATTTITTTPTHIIISEAE